MEKGISACGKERGFQVRVCDIYVGQERKHSPEVLRDPGKQTQWEYPREEPGTGGGCGQQ